MPDAEHPSQSPHAENEAESAEEMRPLVTRRDFLIGGGAGAVAAGVVAGGVFTATQGSRQATLPQPQVVQTAPGGPAAAVVPPPAVAPGTAPAQPAAPAAQTLPLTMRRVDLDIDGVKHNVIVDVRESLWETSVNQLGMSSINLGCDRSTCGACAVVIDGKAVNGCSILSARLGRGQKIITVESLTKGSGVEGLHPIQKAFWWEGGYQCGICTRGFIMATYALLETNKNPTDDQIAEALSGNICRCGEYPKIFNSVKAAAAEMRGEKVNWTAPLKTVEAPKPAAAATTTGNQTKQFQFVTPLPTIEFFDPLQEQLKERKGIVEVSGSERTISVTWDTSLNEAEIRRILSEVGHPLAP